MEKTSAPTAESPEVDVAILDIAIVVQMASPLAARTFQEYADNVLMPYIMKQLQPDKRVDIIWDVYRQDTGSYQREEGLWYTQKDNISSQIPKNWKRNSFPFAR